MQRIAALWARGLWGKVAIVGIPLLLLCCVAGALGRGRTPQPAVVPPPTAAQPTQAPTVAPVATVAPQPTAIPAPTKALDPAGVKPLNKDDCPPDYLIKGNAQSKLYHVPGDQGYAQTDPERCFATVADAVAAGFSAP